MPKTVHKGMIAEGAGKKNAPRHSSDSAHRKMGSSPNTTGLRDTATVKRLQMYKTKGTHKMLKGNQEAPKQNQMARVQPDRRWFGNTRIIGQKELERFRDEMAKQVKDPFSVVLRERKLPLGLLQPEAKTGARPHIVDVESFKDTFGPKKQRKRPKLSSGDMNAMLATIDKHQEDYAEGKDSNIETIVDDFKVQVRDRLLEKGQSKRIHGELLKVIDSADVIMQVLDARDPLGTRSRMVESQLKRPEFRHKQLVLILNKCDLVPTWVTSKWIQTLSKEYPTLAFHASLAHPFGKGALIQLLRQFGQLHGDKKQISVGFVGYPNVGKSSIINTVKGKAVCKAAPIPGETKVWQYVTLMRRIFLIDSPGVVYPSKEDSDTDIILRGVVRIEKLSDCSEYIPEILRRVRPEYIKRTYGVHSEIDDDGEATEFLIKFAKKAGRLLKGGEPDTKASARMILSDFQRGKLPYFTPVPEHLLIGGTDKAINYDDDGKALTHAHKELVPKQKIKNISVTAAFDPLTEGRQNVVEDDDDVDAIDDDDVDVVDEDVDDDVDDHENGDTKEIKINDKNKKKVNEKNVKSKNTSSSLAWEDVVSGVQSSTVNHPSSTENNEEDSLLASSKRGLKRKQTDSSKPDATRRLSKKEMKKQKDAERVGRRKPSWNEFNSDDDDDDDIDDVILSSDDDDIPTPVPLKPGQKKNKKKFINTATFYKDKDIKNRRSRNRKRDLGTSNPASRLCK